MTTNPNIEIPYWLEGYHAEETAERVDTAPDLRTMFRRRAEHRARFLNARRTIRSYRWDIVREERRWLVVALQNRLVQDREAAQ